MHKERGGGRERGGYFVNKNYVWLRVIGEEIYSQGTQFEWANLDIFLVTQKLQLLWCVLYILYGQF